MVILVDTVGMKIDDEQEKEAKEVYQWQRQPSGDKKVVFLVAIIDFVIKCDGTIQVQFNQYGRQIVFIITKWRRLVSFWFKQMRRPTLATVTILATHVPWSNDAPDSYYRSDLTRQFKVSLEA